MLIINRKIFKFLILSIIVCFTTMIYASERASKQELLLDNGHEYLSNKRVRIEENYTSNKVIKIYGAANFFQIPIEIKAQIFLLLDQRDFLNAHCVCYEWGKACQISGIEKILNLSYKKLDQEQCKKLVNLPFSSLIFDNCKLEHQAVLLLSESSKYKKLDLNNSVIGNAGIRALANGNLTSLTSLSLNNGKIRYFEVADLANGNLTSLTSLSLNNGMIGSTGVEALTTGNLTSLTSLNLSGNYIGDDGVKALTTGNLTSLTSLNLSGNYIGDDGVEALTTGNLTSLTSLNLSENYISGKIKQQLINKFPISINF